MQYKIVRNDISIVKADAIVLPANTMLREGSGTSTALYEKAGRAELEKACKEAKKRYKKQLYIGEAIPTLAFNLDADYIIHAIVPKWKGGHNHEYELLSSAYYSSLKLADMMSCKSIAIPLLASGNNGFDFHLAFKIATKSIKTFSPTNKLEDVILVVYGMRITNYIRKLGIPITEEIDQKYVLAKDEQYTFPIVNALKKLAAHSATIGKNVGSQIIDEGFQKAEEYFEDPENIKKLIDIGVQIAGVAIGLK